MKVRLHFHFTRQLPADITEAVELILNEQQDLPKIHVNSSPPCQNGRYFAENIFKCIFMNEKFCISIQISLKFIPRGPSDNNSALVQVMAWRRTGDKLLSEPMLTQFTDAYMRH